MRFALRYLSDTLRLILEIGDPVNGSWTDWGEWTACSPTCGNGTETRSRSCTNPAPRYGGEDCEGDAVETRECENPECPGICIVFVLNTCNIKLNNTI